MRPRGAVNIAPLKTPVELAAAAVKGAKGFVDWWSRPLIDNVDAQAGSYGKDLATSMRKANDHARELLGRLHEAASEYLDSVSGAPGKNFLARRRAISELQGKLGPKGKDYAFSRAQLAVEGKIPLSSLSPEAQHMVKLRRHLTEEIGKLAVAEGVQVIDAKTGAVRPFVPVTDGQRWFRSFTSETRPSLMRTRLSKDVQPSQVADDPLALSLAFVSISRPAPQLCVRQLFSLGDIDAKRLGNSLLICGTETAERQVEEFLVERCCNVARRFGQEDFAGVRIEQATGGERRAKRIFDGLVG